MFSIYGKVKGANNFSLFSNNDYVARKTKLTSYCDEVRMDSRSISHRQEVIYVCYYSS